MLRPPQDTGQRASVRQPGEGVAPHQPWRWQETGSAQAWKTWGSFLILLPWRTAMPHHCRKGLPPAFLPVPPHSTSWAASEEAPQTTARSWKLKGISCTWPFTRDPHRFLWAQKGLLSPLTFHPFASIPREVAKICRTARGIMPAVSGPGSSGPSIVYVLPLPVCP